MLISFNGKNKFITRERYGVDFDRNIVKLLWLPDCLCMHLKNSACDHRIAVTFAIKVCIAISKCS